MNRQYPGSGMRQDTAFKSLHQHRETLLAWGRYLCRRLDLGALIEDSLDRRPTETVDDQGQTRRADSVCGFRTDKGHHLLCLWEFQSTPDPVLQLRQINYAFNQLLAGHREGRYRVREGFPVPVLVSLYTGSRPHRPPAIAELMRPRDRRLMRVDLPTVYFDVQHAADDSLPDEPLLAVALAFARVPNMEEFARTAESAQALDAHVGSTIIRPFARRLLRIWMSEQPPQVQMPELAMKLEQIESMEEIATYARILDQRVDVMVAEGKAEGLAEGKAEGKAEGMAEGLAEGKAEGLAEGHRESLLDLAGQFLDAAQLEVSGRWLRACAVEQLPSTAELYRIAQSGPDAADAILERFRRCRDAAS